MSWSRRCIERLIILFEKSLSDCNFAGHEYCSVNIISRRRACLRQAMFFRQLWVKTMSMLSKARKLSLVVSNPHIFTCRSRYLFILSHMRSRSTVLSHVLGSHREIVGYSELHRRYTTRLDLLKMRADLCVERGHGGAKLSLTNKYLLDKILHDEIPVGDQVLDYAQPKVIILLRDSEATLKSIIQMGQRTGVAWYKDPQKAADYYCKRLTSLSRYAAKLTGRYFYLNADELVDHTDAVLAQLTEWLELQSPLLRHYEQFANTGKRHFGDSSENIRSGVIKKTEGHGGVALPDGVLRRANAQYQQCHSQLLQLAGRPTTLPRSA